MKRFQLIAEINLLSIVFTSIFENIGQIFSKTQFFCRHNEMKSGSMIKFPENNAILNGVEGCMYALKIFSILNESVPFILFDKKCI